MHWDSSFWGITDKIVQNRMITLMADIVENRDDNTGGHIKPKCIYEDAMPLENAYSIIREESGTHFEPEIVDAFLCKQERKHK